MTFKLFLFVSILNLISTKCGTGCLQCSVTLGSSTSCDVCDTMNLYYSEKGGCVKAQDPNCLEIDKNGVCLKCNPKFYPGPSLAGVVAQNSVQDNLYGESSDSNTGIRVTCQPVPQTLSTANCLYYTRAMICTTCDQGFYLDLQSQCRAIDILTPNCNVYNKHQQCMVCNDGFYLTTDQKKCLPLPISGNCLAYTNKSCKSCSEGYYMTTKNNRIYNQSRISNETSSTDKLIGFLFSKQFQRINYNQCVPNDMVGCLNQKDETTCITCKTGYYLDKDNKCNMNPFGEISNCEIYKDSIDSTYSCHQCKNNYMRLGNTDPYLCTPVTPVDFCTTYNGQETTTQCTQCQSGYYVSSATVCTQRTFNTISSCIEYNASKDECKTCSNNYQLIVDATTGNKCAALGTNCRTLDSAGAYCMTCNDNFMPASASTSCISGTIDSCLKYKSAESSTYTAVCDQCNAGYALQDGACVALPKTFETGNIITNVSCQTSELPIMISDFCTLNAIPYCSVYHSAATDTCAGCVDSYRLARNTSGAINTPNTCEAISSTLNCVRWDETNNICKKCSTGFLLYTVGTTSSQCVSAWGYTTSNCDTKSDQETDASNPWIFPNPTAGNLDQFVQTYQPCQKCSAGYIPFKLTYSCMTLPTVSTQTTLVYKDDFTLVSNCAVYNRASSSSSVWKCSQCEQGYYLSLDVKVFTTQACKAFGDFAADNEQLIAVTYDNQRLNKINYVLEDTTIANTTPRVLSASVSYLDTTSITTAANQKSADAANIPTNLVNAACLVSSTVSVMSVVSLFDYDYTNINPEISSTTTQLIDDPDRVTPNIHACVEYSDSIDAIKVFKTTATPTKICDYYFSNSATVADTGDTLNSVGIEGSGTTLTGTNATTYECLRCPIGKQAAISINLATEGAQNAAAGNLIQRKDKGAALAGITALTAVTAQYISSCDAFPDCDSSKNTVYGLQQQWVKTFSCYFCSNGKVPVLNYLGRTKNQPVFYNWSRNNFASGTSTEWTISATDNTTAATNIQCADISTAESIRTSFSISKQILTVAAMPGCGLGVLNTHYGNKSDSTNKFDNTVWGSDGTTAISDNGALVCAACSPNYRPTYYTAAINLTDTAVTKINQQKNWFVTKCTKIDNCNISSNVMMNGCQKCDSGFGFMAKATAGNLTIASTNAANQYIDRTYCIKLPVNNTNCYAYLPLDDGTSTEVYNDTANSNEFSEFGKCVVCNPGYYLNELNFCDKITVHGCNSGSFMEHADNDFLIQTATDYTTANYQSVKFLAYFKQSGVSHCNQCQNGMALFSNYDTKNSASAVVFGELELTDNTKIINYLWTCAASDFVSYLNKTSSWDTKTNKQNYLHFYNYMCNMYEITKIANTANYYKFKYDTYKTDSNSISGTSYLADTSNRETVTATADMYELQCKGCSQNYVLSMFNDYCYPNDLLQNCSVAFDYNDCKECKDDYARVRVPSDIDSDKFVGQCIKLTIPNCATVDPINTNHSDIPMCKTCSGGYYWNTTTFQCLLSNTPNCLVNSSINQCTECKSGYALYANTTGISHCFPNYTTNSLMNCTTQFVEAVNGATVTQLAFKCKTDTCTNGTFAMENNDTLIDSYYGCTKFSQTPNCSEYNLANSGIQPITEVPLCKTCLNNFYLSEDVANNNAMTCNRRFISLNNCLTQSATTDVCEPLGCASGYQLSDAKFCRANPAGVYKCHSYKEDGITCNQCVPEYYLNSTENTCVKVDTTITACVNYSDATTCSLCQQAPGTSYTLSSNGTACSAVTITNCQTWNAAGNLCETCDSGYLLNSEKLVCTKASNQIAGCRVQTSETVCKECVSGWALNPLQSACIFQDDLTFSNKCLDEFIVPQPVCIVCLPGYTLGATGVCEKDQSVSLLVNCLMAQPKDSNKCLICVPGSQMDSVGVCNKTSQTFNTNVIAGLRSRLYRGLASTRI